MELSHDRYIYNTTPVPKAQGPLWKSLRARGSDVCCDIVSLGMSEGTPIKSH